VPWIIAKKDGRPGQAPERRKESLKYVTLISFIGTQRRGFSHYMIQEDKKPRRSGAFLSARDLSLRGSNGRNVRRLKALRPLDYVETNSLSLR